MEVTVPGAEAKVMEDCTHHYIYESIQMPITSQSHRRALISLTLLMVTLNLTVSDLPRSAGQWRWDSNRLLIQN